MSEGNRGVLEGDQIPLIIFIFYNVKIVFKKWEIKSCCCCCC